MTRARAGAPVPSPPSRTTTAASSQLDHYYDPPTPTSEWKPGQTVEYTRTMFIPSYPYVGAAKVAAGMYTPGATSA